MTKKEKDYTKRQLNIIQSKTDKDDLNRYAALLSAAKNMSQEVSAFLSRAVDMRDKELNPIDHLVVGADFD